VRHYKTNWRKRRIDAARLRGKRMAHASWRDSGPRRLAMLTRDIDADTVRARALEDARGQWVGAHVFDHGERWECYRSTGGRTDQIDVFIAGRLAGVVGRKLLGLIIAARYAGAPFPETLAKLRPVKSADVLTALRSA
jgi:hypothetical protein